MPTFAVMENVNQELQLARNYAMYTQRNIFLTGKAGTGKTTFLRQLRQETRKRTIVVAPTGVAAINAGGVTIHSFFQLAPGLFLPDGRMAAGHEGNKHYSFSKQKANILRSLRLLVIDEVSMVRCDLLDAIDDVLRRYQDRNKPFGGVQLLLIGDLQQLAPVTTDDEWQLLQQIYDTPYFFSSTALRQTDFVCIELKRVYRQADESFVQLLNAVRDNQLDQRIMQILNARYMPSFKPPKDEDWITLTTHNSQAAQLNARRMDELTTEPVTFEATVSGDFPESSYPTDARLTLKVGAQVMFCKNDPSPDKAFYNGLIGRVESIGENSVNVVCGEGKELRVIETGPLQWENTRYVSDAATGTISEEFIGSFTQIPLRTAWAITIHKSQGLTFDHAIVNAGRAFSHGQVYVALSRCRSLQGLVLFTPITSDVITTDPDIIEFNTYAEHNAPTVESLIRDRRAFIENILCEIFDFRALSMRLHYFERLATEHVGQYFPAYARTVAATATALDARLAAVGVKFQSQIHQLMPLTTTYSANHQLRERVQKAVAYFMDETARVLGEFFETELPEVDNQRAREQLNSEFALLRTAYNEKMQIYIGCTKDFSIDAYWDAKAKSSMTEENAPRKRKRKVESVEKPQKKTKEKKMQKADVDYETVSDPELYRRLLDWRKSVAIDKKLPPSYVLPIKTVIGLTNLKPRNGDELMAVPGIGKVTATEYGRELLDIVADACIPSHNFDSLHDL